MDNSERSNYEVIFETWLHKLRGNVGETKMSHYLSGAWSKKYFVLLREGDKPKAFYYSKKPKNFLDSQKGVIDLDDHYHVDLRPAFKGKQFVCQLTTGSKNVLLAVEKEEIYNLLLFFIRAQIRLKDEFEDECFVVRPERSEDHRRIGAQSSMCLLHISQWGLTLALQLSKSVLAQWPLRCIRWYECTGRGRFTIETGSHSSTGAGRYVFKTRVGQDSSIYDRIDTLVNEQTRLQGMVMARVSNLSAGLEAFILDYTGLDSLTEVVSDIRFISHLKKISRDIYDQLSEHLGGGGMMDSYNASGSAVELLSSQSSDRSHHVGTVQNRSIDSPQLEFSSLRSDRPRDLVMTSQYLHMGTPVFDMSPINDRAPSISLRSTNGHTPLTESSHRASSKVDYSLEQFIEAPESSGTAEVCRSRRPGASSYKQRNPSSSSTCLRLRSLSLDDLSEYIGASERALSVYTNSALQVSPPESGGGGGTELKYGDDAYPYSYATTPDFGLLREHEERTNASSDDNDGYCRAKNGLSKTLSNPDLLDGGIGSPADVEGSRGSRIRSIRHVIIGQQRNSEDAFIPRVISGGGVPNGPAAEAGASSRQHAVAVETGSGRPTMDMARGISATAKTRVFTRQKSAGNQPLTSLTSPNAPLLSLPQSASAGPPMMSFHPLSEGQASNRSQRQLPELPVNGSASSPRVPHHSTPSRSKDSTTTSFV